MFRDAYFDKTNKKETKHRIQQRVFILSQAGQWVFKKAHRRVNDIASILKLI